MFTVGNYRIVFSKKHSNVKTLIDGHFDIICRVYRENEAWTCGYGVARLHPKDTPNKIIGKKIALTNALKTINELKLGSPSQNKTKRTEIWKAFWKWVESWKINKNPTCFGEPTQESEKCNNCSCLSRCVDKLWRETTSK